MRQAKPKQSEAMSMDNLQKEPQSFPQDLVERDSQTVVLVDLPQEDVLPVKPEKSKRSILRWSIYSLLGFGLLALAAPFFLNQTFGCGNKARSSEARTYVGTMNRGQQAFWLENGAFGSIADLKIGIQEETINYKYEIESFNFVSYQYAIPKNDKAKSFVGAVFVLPDHSQNIQTIDRSQAENQQLTTFAILCESLETSVKTKLPKPFLNNNGKPACAQGTISLN